LEFKKTFNEWVKNDRPKSFLFYSGIYDILLECPAIKDLPLGEIQEPEGEQMKFWALKRVSKTTVNRYIATLRKALRYACHTLHLIDKAPVIKQFPPTKMSNVKSRMSLPLAIMSLGYR
jgi:hypothetical protein